MSAVSRNCHRVHQRRTPLPLPGLAEQWNHCIRFHAKATPPLAACPQTVGRVIEDGMTSEAPLTDDNPHIAALCSMVELFLQHGLKPTPARRGTNAVSGPCCAWRAPHKPACSGFKHVAPLQPTLMGGDGSFVSAGMVGRSQGGNGCRPPCLCCMLRLRRQLLRRLTPTWALTSCAPVSRTVRVPIKDQIAYSCSYYVLS